MRKDLIITFLTQFAILAISLLLYRWFKLTYGDIGFSEYALFKRSSGYLNSFLLMGLGVAIPRQIALDLGKKNDNPSRYLSSGLILISIGVLILVLLGGIFTEELSFLLFGEKEYTYLIYPLILVVVAIMCQTSVYGYFRGCLKMKEANIYQFSNMGIAPILALILSTSVQNYFYWLGGILILFFLITLFYIKKKIKFNIETQKRDCKTLFLYGIQRMPGDFALASLFALPAILVTHTQGVLEAGYVAFGISLLSMVGQLFGPIGLVFLPKISMLVGEKNMKMVKSHTLKLLFITIASSLVGVAIFQLFSKEILNLYLGDVESKLNEITKAIIFGGVFYAIYVTMRSVIDSYYTKAYNTVSVVITLSVFLIIFFISRNVIIALNMALATLALCTFYFLLKILIPEFHFLKKKSSNIPYQD